MDESRLDAEGVQLLTPEQNATRPVDAPVDLEWRAVSGAATYDVRIWRDAALTDEIEGSPFEVAASTLRRTLPEGTYYWQVVSDITASSAQTATGLFGVIGDTLFVYCAGDCGEDAARPELGTREAPFRSIQRAVTAAGIKHIGRVAVASAEAPYEESVTMVAGVSLLGGFDSTFTTRSGRTAVRATGAALLAIGLTGDAETTVEGFTFINDNPTFSFAGRIAECDASLVVRDSGFESRALRAGTVTVTDGRDGIGPLFSNVDITADQTERTSEAIALGIMNAALRLEDSRVTLTSSGDGLARAKAVDAVDSSLRVKRAAVRIDATGGAYGMRVAVLSTEPHVVDIEDTTVDAFGSGGSSALELFLVRNARLTRSTLRARSPNISTGMFFDSCYAFVVSSSVIEAGDARMVLSTESSTAVTLRAESSGTFVNNTFVFGHATDTQLGFQLFKSFPSFVNNLIISAPPTAAQNCSGPSPCRAGVRESAAVVSPPADPAEVVAKLNNVFVGLSGVEHVRVGSGSYAANAGGTSPCTAIADGNQYVASLADLGLSGLLGSDGVLATADDELVPTGPLVGHVTTSDDCAAAGNCNQDINLPIPTCGSADRDRTGAPFGGSPPIGAFLPR